MKLGNGESTSFWHDAWEGEDSLADRFPALLSHCKNDSLTVKHAKLNGLEQVLVPRLTGQARSELQHVRQLLRDTRLTDDPDARHSPFATTDGRLRTSLLYRLLNNKEQPTDTRAGAVWSCCVPPRVKFFGWLLLQGRLQCRSQLRKRNVVGDNSCELCQGCEETVEHIMFECPFACSFWNALRIATPPRAADLMENQPPPHVPATQFGALMLLGCWVLWKRRNGVVFRQEAQTLAETIRQAREEARLWSCRLRREDGGLGDIWCHVFTTAM